MIKYLENTCLFIAVQYLSPCEAGHGKLFVNLEFVGSQQVLADIGPFYPFTGGAPSEIPGYEKQTKQANLFHSKDRQYLDVFPI